MWISFDGGAHWQDFRINLAGGFGARHSDPAAVRRPRDRDARPRRWILDDLNSIQQLGNAQRAGAMLFRRAPPTSTTTTLTISASTRASPAIIRRKVRFVDFYQSAPQKTPPTVAGSRRERPRDSHRQGHPQSQRQRGALRVEQSRHQSLCLGFHRRRADEVVGAAQRRLPRAEDRSRSSCPAPIRFVSSLGGQSLEAGGRGAGPIRATSGRRPSTKPATPTPEILSRSTARSTRRSTISMRSGSRWPAAAAAAKNAPALAIADRRRPSGLAAGLRGFHGRLQERRRLDSARRFAARIGAAHGFRRSAASADGGAARLCQALRRCLCGCHGGLQSLCGLADADLQARTEDRGNQAARRR